MRVLTTDDNSPSFEVIPSNGTASLTVTPVPNIVQVTKDLGTLPSGATTLQFTVPGVVLGDVVVPNASPFIPASIGILQYHVTAPDTVDMLFYNLGAPVAAGPQTFRFGVARG